MRRELIVDIVQRLPQGALSRAWGWLARVQQPRPAIHLFKRFFVAATGIDLKEAGEPLHTFQSLEELFVRRLKPGARRIDPDPKAVVSPVDGAVGMCGKVEQGTMLQVKGRSYRLSDLLDDASEAAAFEGGAYATLYLAPRDYHRIHAPLAGQVSEAVLVPGGLLPVFPEALQRVDGLFARNERVITYLDVPDAGRIAVIKVGATLVGRISVSYDATLHTNRKGQKRQCLNYEPPHILQKGGELGSFELGSTVVLVGQPGKIDFNHLQPGALVRMGQRIGSVLEARKSRTTSPRRPKARQRSN